MRVYVKTVDAIGEAYPISRQDNTSSDNFIKVVFADGTYAITCKKDVIPVFGHVKKTTNAVNDENSDDEEDNDEEDNDEEDNDEEDNDEDNTKNSSFLSNILTDPSATEQALIKVFSVNEKYGFPCIYGAFDKGKIAFHYSFLKDEGNINPTRYKYINDINSTLLEIFEMTTLLPGVTEEKDRIVIAISLLKAPANFSVGLYWETNNEMGVSITDNHLEDIMSKMRIYTDMGQRISKLFHHIEDQMRELINVVASVSIPGVGLHVGKILEREYKNAADFYLAVKQNKDFSHIEGIGQEANKSISQLV